VKKLLLNTQYLRGLGGMVVVLFHAGADRKFIIGVGESWISLFFITSGFFFWWMSTGRDEKPMAFLLRRLARLVPIYWLATGVLALMALASHRYGAALFDHTLKSLLFIPHTDPSSGRVEPLLVPGWTLVYEMFFCLLFAASLRLKQEIRLQALLGVLFALVLIGRVLRPGDPVLATFTNTNVLLEFAAGLWLGSVFERLRPSFGACLCLIAVGAVAAPMTHAMARSLPSLAVSAAPALLMMVGVLGLDQFPARPIAWLKKLGDASYSIYVWHRPIIGWTSHLLTWCGIRNDLIHIAISTLAGALLGLVLFEAIEKPLTDRLYAEVDRRYPRRSSRPAVRAQPAA
jgi:exopolysaccharide production protein ExoZ